MLKYCLKWSKNFPESLLSISFFFFTRSVRFQNFGIQLHKAEKKKGSDKIRCFAARGDSCVQTKQKQKIKRENNLVMEVKRLKNLNLLS